MRNFKTHNARIGAWIVLLFGLLPTSTAFAEDAHSLFAGKDEKPVVIGKIKWAAYDAATSRTLSNGVREKSVLLSDVKIRRIQKTMYDKEIELGSHFFFGVCDSTDWPKRGHASKLPDGRDIDADGYVSEDRSKAPSSPEEDYGGFGLTGNRDDLETFSWEWFNVQRPGHATKLQESGELSFDKRKTPNGTEINHMLFLTDVSIRVSRRNDPCKTEWRIKIFKGSVIDWPTLVNGKVEGVSDSSTPRSDDEK